MMTTSGTVVILLAVLAGINGQSCDTDDRLEPDGGNLTTQIALGSYEELIVCGVNSDLYIVNVTALGVPRNIAISISHHFDTDLDILVMDGGDVIFPSQARVATMHTQRVGVVILNTFFVLRISVNNNTTIPLEYNLTIEIASNTEASTTTGDIMQESSSETVIQLPSETEPSTPTSMDTSESSDDTLFKSVPSSSGTTSFSSSDDFTEKISNPNDPGSTNSESLSSQGEQSSLPQSSRGVTDQNKAETEDGQDSTVIALALTITGAIIGCFCVLVAVFVVLFMASKHSEESSSGGKSFSSNSSFLSGGLSPRTRSHFELRYSDIELIEKIGQGAFGVVWSGKWRGNTCAVKEMKSSEMTEKEVNQFRAEAEVMCSLRPHINVVLFLGFTAPPDPLCIVTEFCQHKSLFNYLRETSNTVDLAFQMKILSEVASGMMHLHKEGIVHRDLAARNVVIAAGYTAKVADFGLSRTVDILDDGGQTKSEVGPLKWMAPEALRDKLYSFKTDVWSYGVLIFEVLTRSEPYPGLTPVQAASRVVYRNLRLPIPRDSHIIISKIMSACLETEPTKRPTFQDICDTFNRFDKECRKNSERVLVEDKGSARVPKTTDSDSDYDRLEMSPMQEYDKMDASPQPLVSKSFDFSYLNTMSYESYEVHEAVKKTRSPMV